MLHKCDAFFDFALILKIFLVSRVKRFTRSFCVPITRKNFFKHTGNVWLVFFLFNVILKNFLNTNITFHLYFSRSTLYLFHIQCHVTFVFSLLNVWLVFFSSNVNFLFTSHHGWFSLSKNQHAGCFLFISIFSLFQYYL